MAYMERLGTMEVLMKNPSQGFWVEVLFRRPAELQVLQGGISIMTAPSRSIQGPIILLVWLFGV